MKKQLLALTLAVACVFSTVIPATVSSAAEARIYWPLPADKNYVCFSTKCNRAIQRFTWITTPYVTSPGYYCTVCHERYRYN